MKFEHVVITNDKIKNGNIVELRLDSEGKKTPEPDYYLMFSLEQPYEYYLVSIKTGAALTINKKTYFKNTYFKEEIQKLIKDYNGVIYTEKDTKLVLEEYK